MKQVSSGQDKIGKNCIFQVNGMSDSTHIPTSIRACFEIVWVCADYQYGPCYWASAYNVL